MLNNSLRASQFNCACTPASEQDIPLLCNLLEVSAKWLAERGMHNWDDFYTTERVSEYLNDRETYCVRLKNDIVGTVTLYAADDELGWHSENPAIYVNALAVHPSHHNQRLGSSLLLYAEDIARQRGYEFVRLDVVKDFTWLTDFYNKRGYEVVGEVQRRFLYLQFEKKLL